MRKTFREHYERWGPLSFFLLGFAYDIWSLGPIDSGFNIAKQALFLFLIALLISYETMAFVGAWTPSPAVARVWRYQDEAIHFLLGSLLSEFTLFFFKSSSLWTSFAFLLLLGSILVLNEFKRFQGGSGIAVRSALFGLCLFAYFGYLIPLLLRFVGIVPFFLALAATGAVMAMLVRWLRKKIPAHTQLVDRQIAAPISAMLLAIGLLDFFGMIPPVPVSVQYLGIFHEVRKEQGRYYLGFDRNGESLFQNGAKVFYAKPGDRPHCFARIYAPGRFSDEVQLRWLKKDDKRGWQTADVIRMPISGGREQGFRGYTYKSNYQPGDWQVRVETTNGRELGRVYFSIVPTQVAGEYAYEDQ